jgi:predicted ATPase/DNA-binding CsgD family transcriptional regulator
MDTGAEAASAPSDWPEQPARSLPIVPTSFVGRRDDVRQVIEHLTGGRSRCLTIVGPAGVGKTRLALQVATELTGTVSGEVIFVPLAAVDAPELVIPTILQHLGVHDPSRARPADQLRNALRDLRMLLVLDNMEHLLPCAPDLGEALAASPDTRLLVTSQAPLGLSGEQMYPLAPLQLPEEDASAEHIYAADAVALFVERAHAVNPHLIIDARNAGIVAGLCRHLDGLPLAIELAAARSSIMNPVAILERLDRRFSVLASGRMDVPERLRTLQNAIGWSYDLLDRLEQRMFRWLSIFAGGISIAAIEAFPLDDERTTGEFRSPLDLLERLVSRSLIRAVMTPGIPPRFVMLETLRAYGQQQLLTLGDDTAARDWHARWFAALAATAAPQLAESGQQAAIDLLSLEWGNLRQALSWFRSRDQAASVLELCALLWRFWSMHGMATEGRMWTAYALDASPTDATIPRGEALKGAAYLAEDQNDLADAERFLRLALDVFEQIDDPAKIVSALSGLGSIAHDRRDYATALAWHRRALDAANASGDRRARAVALGNLGGVSYLQGDYQFARACSEEAVALLNALGDQHGEAILLGNLGAQLLELNELDAARDNLERALALMRALGDMKSIACDLINLAEVHFRAGERETPLPMLAEAAHLLRQTGNQGDAAIAEVTQARVFLDRGDSSAALTTIRDCLRTFQKVDDLASAAEAMEFLACCAVALGAAADAQTLFTNAGQLRVVIQAPMRPSLAEETKRAQQRMRDLLGPAIESSTIDNASERTPTALLAEAIRMADTLCRRAAASPPESATTVPGTSPHTPQPPIPPGATCLAMQRYVLTLRECDVLRLLTEGKSTREMADELFISPRTVATHITNILGKLGVNSRAAAVALSLRLHLV